MAISFISSATATKDSGVANLTIDKPSGVQSGDVLVAFISVHLADSITPPGGWTQIYDTAYTDIRGGAYYKYVSDAGDEPASYDFAIGPNKYKACGGIACYRGVNHANVVNASASRYSSGSDVYAPQVTTDVDGCQILASIAHQDIYIYLPPSGCTERWDISKGIGTGCSSTMADTNQASAGASGIFTFNENPDGTTEYVAGTVALEPMVDPHEGEGTVHTADARHKFLVLDNDYALIEDWTDLVYTRERFGLGTFFITLPLDHSLADALDQYKRSLIVRGDEDWVNQEARLWGVILHLKKFFARDAGPDTGGDGVGAAYVTAWGVTFTDYLLSGRVYPLPQPVELNPNGAGQFTDWTGDHTDVDEGVDSHDGDGSYLASATKGATELVALEDYADRGTVLAGIRIRSVWRTPSAGVLTPHVVLRDVNHHTMLTDPNGNGADTDWTGDYTAVDDGYYTPDDDVTYISSSTVGHKESFTVVEPGLARNAVFPRVILQYRARKTTADSVVIKPYLRIGGTRYYGDNKSLIATYGYYSYVWTLNPGNNECWKVSDLDGIEIGVEVVTCAGGEARVTMMALAAPYLFQYELDQVEETYAVRYVDLEKNPATVADWTDSDVDGLQVGVRLIENRTAWVTAIGVTVYHRVIAATGNLDDILKDWVNANLGAGAAAARQVTGFTEEADESAGPSGTYEIAYNVLLQRFLELCKLHDVGMEITGDWNGGATRLDAAASYTFRTFVPEGVDRTHDNGVFDPVVITRDRGIVGALDYELDAVGAKTLAYVLGEKDGLAPSVEETFIAASEPTGFDRREAVLDVEATDESAALTALGEKFLGDEGAKLEMVGYEHSPADIHIPLTDFWPGDLVTFYDDKLGIGPLQPKVESITCRIGGDGVEQYKVQLGGVKRPALAEDAAFRAAGKRKTLYVKQ